MLQTVLLTIGGSTVVLSALFTFLGRIWINRIHALDVEESNKRYAEYEASINRTVAELAAKNEPKIHVHKVQVEAEYKRYETLWDNIQLLLPLLSTIEGRIGSKDLEVTADGIRKQHIILADWLNGCYPFIDNSVYQRATVCVQLVNKINLLLWEKDGVIHTEDMLQVNLAEILKCSELFTNHTHTIAHSIKNRIELMTNLEQ
ncbi:hypothetical protein DA096_09025 [Vibrio rotiferianus]|uniref:hypothetical protein n=1 Tax=Vibrio rotiferianus TaxID=190895 RepID=UPI001110EED2|nr:hypothetical protein [Vibrio rotiferianus]TMX41385.1 hypothetical protein DA095_07380 [Vibrio rotiferianus]TMX46816.1 hypothetical protein DA093_19245 [Vibrio rotiferianus]TMX66001.1 hypothetical protein DA096_09025 [Vibrio rotiferianus]